MVVFLRTQSMGLSYPYFAIVKSYGLYCRLTMGALMIFHYDNFIYALGVYESGRYGSYFLFQQETATPQSNALLPFWMEIKWI